MLVKIVVSLIMMITLRMSIAMLPKDLVELTH